jgi:hypothetical protein
MSKKITKITKSLRPGIDVCQVHSPYLLPSKVIKMIESKVMALREKPAGETIGDKKVTALTYHNLPVTIPGRMVLPCSPALLRLCWPV